MGVALDDAFFLQSPEVAHGGGLAGEAEVFLDVSRAGHDALFALMLLRVPVGMAMGLVGVAGYAYMNGGAPAPPLHRAPLSGRLHQREVRWRLKLGRSYSPLV